MRERIADRCLVKRPSSKDASKRLIDEQLSGDDAQATRNDWR
jgi:hypothetical protein